MNHTPNSNKVVPFVIGLGLVRMIVDIVVAKKIYGNGLDDEWKETVNFANHERGIHPIWEDNVDGEPVLGLISADYLKELMNKNKKED